MVAGTLSCLLFFLFAVIRLRPWYDPRYFIPLAGMLIGNSMTGISLAVRQLQDMMDSQRPLVEQALMLGATPSEATRRIINQAYDSAIMLAILGAVSLTVLILLRLGCRSFFTRSDQLIDPDQNNTTESSGRSA